MVFERSLRVKIRQFSKNKMTSLKRARFPVIGLVNLGNTCFMNSALACLFQSPLLTPYFLDNLQLSEVKDNISGQVVLSYRKLVQEVFKQPPSKEALKSAITNHRKVVRTATPTLRALFRHSHQQDAQEYLSQLLDQLHIGLTRAHQIPDLIGRNGDPASALVAFKQTNGDSMVMDHFLFQVRSRLQCAGQKCTNESTKYDPCTLLALEIPSPGEGRNGHIQ